MSNITRWVRSFDTLYLRLALATGFFSAVADRFGLWGPQGTPGVAWGNFARFTAYAGTLNPWAPARLVPLIAWTATTLEILFACLLILGLFTRLAGFLSGMLLLLFALGMIAGRSIKAPLDYSVFAASAAAFALVACDSYPLSLDGLRRLSARGSSR